MLNAQWPTREADPDLNQKWSDAVFSQGKVFRSLMQEASIKSRLVTNLFEGWTGSTSVSSSITRKPVLFGPQLSFPLYGGREEVLVDLAVVSIRRR